MNSPPYVSNSILVQCNLHRHVNTALNATIHLPEEHLVQSLISAISGLFTHLFSKQVDEFSFVLVDSSVSSLLSMYSDRQVELKYLFPSIKGDKVCNEVFDFF